MRQGMARPGWLAFRCEGRDALDLLSRLSTNDLAPLARGEAVTTLFLNPNGRVLHRVLLATEEGFVRAVAEPGSVSLPQWVDTYTFAEDCRVVRDEAAGVLLALGGAAGERIAASGLRHARRDWGALPVSIAWGPRDAVDAATAGGTLLDASDVEQARIECGEPALGKELTEERFPLEAGLIAEISFTKGCYTGQEVVARQDTYGKVARRLVRLAFDGPVRAGDELADEGRGCAITSVAPLLVDGRVRALGYVASKNARPGSTVHTGSGVAGLVI